MALKLPRLALSAALLACAANMVALATPSVAEDVPVRTVQDQAHVEQLSRNPYAWVRGDEAHYVGVDALKSHLIFAYCSVATKVCTQHAYDLATQDGAAALGWLTFPTGTTVALIRPDGNPKVYTRVRAVPAGYHVRGLPVR